MTTKSQRRAAASSDVAMLFDGGRLTLARQLAGLRKNGLATLIGKTPTAVAFYESGSKKPSSATVAQLSLALGVEPEFFLPGRKDLSTPNPPPHFRSLRTTSQLAREQAEAFGYLVVDLCLTAERHVEFPEPNLPQIPVSLEDVGQHPEEAARLLRAKWGLSNGPVGHLVRLAENNGVLTVFTPPQTASVDAYSINTTERPVILLNPIKDDYCRQRFDMAHELGHLVMHLDVEPGNSVAEHQANRFAAEFLMPAEEIVGILPSRANWTALGQLKEKWGVSLQALLFRARQLKKMSDSTYRNAIVTLSSKGWRRREPGPIIAVEQPSLLPQAIALLEQAGLREETLVSESRVPLNLLRIITARTPHRVIDPSAEIKATLQAGDVQTLLPGAEDPA